MQNKQAIELDERAQQQPNDKARAQTAKADSPSIKNQNATRDNEKQRIQEKQGGHHLPPHATKNPMDDTDRNTDKVIKPSQRKP